MNIVAKPTIAILFKPVPGGFVYRAPNAWLIGRAKHYFVTEVQRDEITAASQPPSLIAMFSWLMTMPLLGVGAAMAFNWFRHPHQLNELTPGDIAIIVVATLLSMLLAFKIAMRPQTNRLHLLLTTLPKSDVRITRDDIRGATMDMYSAKQLWLQAALSAFAAVLNLSLIYFQSKPGRSVLSGDPISILFLTAACLVVGAAILQFRLAMRKMKEEHTRG